MKHYTTSELATALKLDKDAASGLVVVLRKQGLLTASGSAPKPPGQKGRTESVYEGEPAQINAFFEKLRLTE